MGVDIQTEVQLLFGVMETQEFNVTEAGMRAVLETMTTMSHAMTELSRQLDAANEALVILAHRVDDIECSVPA